MQNKKQKIVRYINAESEKSKQELEDIKKDLQTEDTAEEGMEKSLKKLEDQKKEVDAFSKMQKKDFSKMTLEEMIELQKRMRDLGVGKKASGGKVYSKTIIRKVPVTD